MQTQPTADCESDELLDEHTQQAGLSHTVNIHTSLTHITFYIFDCITGVSKVTTVVWRAVTNQHSEGP